MSFKDDLTFKEEQIFLELIRNAKNWYHGKFTS